MFQVFAPASLRRSEFLKLSWRSRKNDQKFRAQQHDGGQDYTRASATMPKRSSSCWEHVTRRSFGPGNVKAQCNYCSHEATTNPAAWWVHIADCPAELSDALVSAKREAAQHVQAQTSKRARSNAAAAVTAAAAAKASAASAAENREALAGTPLARSFGVQKRAIADEAVARWIYANGMPLRSVEDYYFKQMLAAVGEAGPTYKPPTRAKVTGPLMEQEEQRVKAHNTAIMMGETAKYGAACGSDAWTDANRRCLVNIIKMCTKGEFFEDSVDTSGNRKSMEYIAGLMAKHIDKGTDFVVMDGACKGAVQLLMDKFPWLSGVVCTTHSLDLLLEDIGKLEFASKLLADFKRVVKYIRGHHATHALWREIGDAELLMPGETRFGTQFLMLERVLKNKDGLLEFARSDKFADYISKLTAAERVAAKEVKKILLEVEADSDDEDAMPSVWERAAFLKAVLEPIFSLLRRTDSTVPLMGKVYWAVYELGEKLEALFKAGSKWAKFEYFKQQEEAILAMHGQRWVYLHCDYHSAGYALDPNFITHDVNAINNGEVLLGLQNTVKRIFHGDSQSYKSAMKQYGEWREQRGVFADPAVMELAEGMAAHEWWHMYAGAFPELRKVACRVLSKVTSASACERNWSAFAAVQTPKRTRLQSKTLKCLVYLRSNLRIQQRAKDPEYKQALAAWEAEAVPQFESDSEQE